MTATGASVQGLKTDWDNGTDTVTLTLADNARLETSNSLLL
jgi:hypothetical protein